ncbi:MAG TPA: MotE family protein [Rhizobium sp.]|nr:MotE family protein [Rhizobium sp.]
MKTSESVCGALRRRITISRSVLVSLWLAGMLPAASAQETVRVDPSQTTADEIRQYCTNIADPARDQRYLLQKQELEKLQADVDSRIEVLEKRKAEYEDWLKRRNDFMQQAEVNLIEIYKNMKADAAAPQLENIDAILAAAIIMKLPARQSSLILSEMNAEKAAIVAAVMSSAADPTTSKDPS